MDPNLKPKKLWSFPLTAVYKKTAVKVTGVNAKKYNQLLIQDIKILDTTISPNIKNPEFWLQRQVISLDSIL